MGSNLRVVNNIIPDILDDLDWEVGEMLLEMANSGEAFAKSLFNTGGAGRAYWRGGVVHIASPPGGPPSVDTGAYRASIQAEWRSETESAVVSDIEYAEYLEYGTINMDPRPVFAPMAEELKADIPIYVGALMKRLLS